MLMHLHVFGAGPLGGKVTKNSQKVDEVLKAIHVICTDLVTRNSTVLFRRASPLGSSTLAIELHW